jgi:hypothetical protein
MAEINRQRIIRQREGRKTATYEMEDSVMYWEPVQAKKLDGEDEFPEGSPKQMEG